MSDNDDRDERGTTTPLAGTPPVAFVKGEPPLCSFCGRGRNEYTKLVTGPRVNICNFCVASAKQQLEGPA